MPGEFMIVLGPQSTQVTPSGHNACKDAVAPEKFPLIEKVPSPPGQRKLSPVELLLDNNCIEYPLDIVTSPLRLTPSFPLGDKPFLYLL